MGEGVGLIAGRGRFPLELARGARARGRRVVAVAIEGLADVALEGEVDALHRLPLGQLERLAETFRSEDVAELVLAGKVPKARLWDGRVPLRPDASARALLEELRDRKDDSILAALAEWIEGRGFRLLEQLALVPELRAPEGPLGRVPPSEAQERDVAFGWPVAKALGELDVGQTVVVQERAVLALEAVEGTDAAIRRGCGLGRPGACAVKVAKPRQDPRFDVPAVGPDTVRALAEGGGACLAFEAGATLLLDREALRAEADARGIALLGVAPGRLPGGAAS